MRQKPRTPGKRLRKNMRSAVDRKAEETAQRVAWGRALTSARESLLAALPERLERLRQAGETDEAFAIRIKVPRSTLAGWLGKGLRKHPADLDGLTAFASLNGELSIDWLTGREVPAIELEKYLAQYVRERVTQRIEDGAFDQLGPVALDKHAITEARESWPVDGASLLQRMLDREEAALRKWLEWHNSEPMLRMLAADLREVLEELAPRLDRGKDNDAAATQYRIAVHALQGLMYVADELKEEERPPLQPPRMINYKKVPTPVRGWTPKVAMSWYRDWLEKHTASDKPGWPMPKPVVTRRKMTAEDEAAARSLAQVFAKLLPEKPNRGSR